MSTIERERTRAVDPGAILSGLTLIGVGVAFWLYREGYVDGLDLATFWPVALICWGIAGVVARPRDKSSGGSVLIVVGVFLLLNNLGYAGWPMALVALGILLVWRGWRDDATLDRATNREAEVNDDR